MQGPQLSRMAVLRTDELDTITISTDDLMNLDLMTTHFFLIFSFLFLTFFFFFLHFIDFSSTNQGSGQFPVTSMHSGGCADWLCQNDFHPFCLSIP